MNRFNLLLINSDLASGHRIVKSLYKVFKHNFLFEVDTLDEARKILGKLTIDMIVVDLDSSPMILKTLQEENQGKLLIGVYEDRRNIAQFDPQQIRLFHKNDLLDGFLTELKAIKKVYLERQRVVQDSLKTASFSGYATLAGN